MPFSGFGGGGSVKGIPFAPASSRRLFQSAQAGKSYGFPHGLVNALLNALLYFACETNHDFTSQFECPYNIDERKLGEGDDFFNGSLKGF